MTDGPHESGDEQVGAMMAAIDPARDISDAVLVELSPEEVFWQRLEVEDDFGGVGSRGRRGLVRGAWAIAAAVLSMVVIFNVASSSGRPGTTVAAQLQPRGYSAFRGTSRPAPLYAPADFKSLTTLSAASFSALPLCAQSAIVETLDVPATSASTRVWRFSLALRNRGASCRVLALWLLPQGVAGRAHDPIYGLLGGPYIPPSKLPWKELAGHRTTRLPFEVLSPRSPAYVARQRSDSTSPDQCSPAPADGFIEAALNTGWRQSFFPLPYSVPICREGLYNVWGDPSS